MLPEQLVHFCPVSGYLLKKRSLTEIYELITVAEHPGEEVASGGEETDACFSRTCSLAKDFQETLHHAAVLRFHSLCRFSVCKTPNQPNATGTKALHFRAFSL